VAKIHEICRVVSSSNIVLCQVRSDLVVGEEVPIGLSTAACQALSIMYFWAWQIWTGAIESDLSQSSSRRIGLLAIVITASSLVAMAGPSSAITLLPRPDWWSVSIPAFESTVNYIANESSKLWPRHLLSRDLPNNKCILYEPGRQPNLGYQTVNTRKYPVQKQLVLGLGDVILDKQEDTAV